MRKVTALVLLSGLFAFTFAARAAAEDRPRNIILIGWDGAQRNHVNEALERGDLPNLKKLSGEGTMVEIDVYGTTDTKAGWSEILSGYGPKKTGVYSNREYQPVPTGYSVFERLESHFGDDNFVTVAVIGKKSHCGERNPPRKIRLDEAKKDAGQAAGDKAKAGAKRPAKQEGKIVVEDGVRYRVIPGSPYYHMADNTDVWIFGLTEDEKVGTQALKLLDENKDKPFFFFVHFAEVDQKGHKHGENSKEYNDALVSNDKWTDKIVAKLKELGLYDKTLIYVTADHGFDEGKTSHGNAPFVFLATNDKQVKRSGRRDDITPTILDRFGLDLCKLDPALDGRSLTRDDDRPKPEVPPGRPKQQPKKQAKAKARKAALALPAAEPAEKLLLADNLNP